MNPSSSRCAPFSFSWFSLRVLVAVQLRLGCFWPDSRECLRIKLKELERYEEKGLGGSGARDQETKSTTSIRSGREAERSEAERFPTDRGRCFVGSRGAQRSAEPRSTSPSARSGSDVLLPLVRRFASGSRAELRVTKTSVARPSAPRLRFAPLRAARRPRHGLDRRVCSCPRSAPEIVAVNCSTKRKGSLSRLVDGHYTLDVYENGAFHALALSSTRDVSLRGLPRRRAATYPHCASFRALGVRGHHV